MNQMENQQDTSMVVKAKPEPGFSFKGLIRVFSKPTEFYEQLKDNPKVLVPLLAMLVMALIAMFFLMDQIAAFQMEMQADSLRDRGMSEAQIQEIANSPIMKYMSLLGAPFVMLTPFITAGIAMLFGAFVMGGKASYMKIVSVMAYAEIVYFAGGLVNLPFQILKETMTPIFSLAVLTPDLTLQDPLFVALMKISPFYIWHIIVAGIGLSIIFGFSRNKGYLLSVLSIGLLSALHVGMAVVGQMFQ